MTYSRRQLFQIAATLAAGSTMRGAEVTKRDMIVKSARPYDVEMPMSGFQHYLTPIENFYVRSHHYTPTVDLASWKLTIEGEVNKTVSLTMDDLKKLPKVEAVAVCECAGNGRGLFDPSMPGLQWGYGSVGNAKWTGVRLIDVLKLAGVKPSAIELLQDGVDVPIGTMPKFQRALPIKRAMDPNTMLAYEMNGQPIPIPHGFPLRMVVPGWATDSWTKWLTKITALDKEFQGFFMKTAYRYPLKLSPPGVAVPADQMRPVQSLRVKSVIAAPLTGGQVSVGKPVTISGAAWTGDDGPVTALDVSTDGGRTWKPATFGPEHSQFGWRLWHASWTPAHEGYFNVMARARTAKDIQPFSQEWNQSGYQNNKVHQIGLEAVTGEPKAGTPEGQPPAVAPSSMPASVRSSCLPCHGSDVMEQQRLTKAQWDKEVEKMKGWGAVVKPEDKSAIVDYLTSKWGYRPR
ncbi:MAG: molybdopterin-dependent oxidoreductase [Bryobacteraceae bacterium]